MPGQLRIQGDSDERGPVLELAPRSPTTASSPSEGPVRIMCAADAAFFPFLPTTINAAVRHTRRRVEVGVLVKDVSATAKRELKRHFPDADIHFFDVDGGKLGELSHKMALSPMAYGRILLADLVDWERFVYLDVDALVLSDLNPLYDVELGDSPFAGRFLSGSLNSGVLLVNAAQWRREGLGERILEYARVNRPREADQASIEAVCGHRAIQLDAQWNTLIDPIWGRHLLSPEAYRDAKILHFITGFKPWNLGRLLLPRELVRLWDRHTVKTRLQRQIRAEAKLVVWQGKTLVSEVTKAGKAWIRRG